MYVPFSKVENVLKAYSWRLLRALDMLMRVGKPLYLHHET